jgi:hypothetical protein
MENEIEINDGHYLELMDRLHIIMSNLDDHCVEHPLVEQNQDIKLKIEDAISSLWDAYQLVGNKIPD